MESKHLNDPNVVTMVDVLNKERGACSFYIIIHFLLLFLLIKKTN